jgi:Flp pilus assembly protein TadG
VFRSPASTTRPRVSSDQRGSVSIQMVILMPALFAVMFLGMQAALYYHARSVAIAAAQEGAREAGSQHGTRQAGVQVAQDFLGDAGGKDVMTDTGVTGSRSPTTATITVTGLSLSVVPGWRVRVTQSASVPVERLTP